jgi:hypothetical protein
MAAKKDARLKVWELLCQLQGALSVLPTLSTEVIRKVCVEFECKISNTLKEVEPEVAEWFTEIHASKGVVNEKGTDLPSV